MSGVDWAAARAEFPAVDTIAYLNTAAGGPVGRAAAAAGAGYYEATLRDGDVHWEEWLRRVEGIRGVAARFLNARPRQVAFTTNASSGLNMAARTLAAESSTPRRVVAVRGDFPSITLPWLQAGFDVQFLDPDPHGGIPPQRLETALKAPGTVLALGSVHYRTGYRYDLDAVGALCRDRGAAWVLDVTQGLGGLRVDVARSDPDFLVSSAYKWLNAGYGVGLLCVAERHLRAGDHAAVGWRSALDPYALVSDRLELTDAALALEMGHPPFAGIFSLGAALDLVTSLGPEAIEDRVLDLADRLRDVLAGAGLSPLDLGARRHRSGIVWAPHADAAALKEALQEEGVLVSARGGGLRCSTHFYNDARDLDALVGALESRYAAPAGGR